jgi:hypothetical protein
MIEIGPKLGVHIMINNYFHNVAIGLLASSSFALWLIMRNLSETDSRETKEYFIRIYRSMTKLAKFSLAGILIFGVPRTLFYRDFEWANAVSNAQVPAIIVQHILVLGVVAVGVYFWHKLSKKVREIETSLETGDPTHMTSHALDT